MEKVQEKKKTTSNAMPLILVFSLRKRMREIIAVGLLQCNYRIIQATTSQEAHLKANQYAPELVIADISEKNVKDILLVNRLIQSVRTAKTIMLSIVPGNLKVQLESLIIAKDKESEYKLSKHMQLIEFPFDFTGLLSKINTILMINAENNKVSQSKENSSSEQLSVLQRGKILFDHNVTKEKKFEQIVSLLRKQWAFPFTIIKALDIIGSRESCSRELARCIQTDVAASAAILKVANTVFFAKRHGRVTEVLDAIVRVGFEETRNLLSCFALIDLSCKLKTKSGFTRNEFWLHSLTTGIMAQKLCENAGYKRPEHAFVAGLLHDIGKVPLDNNFHEVFPRLLDETTSQIVAFYETEYQLMNFTHSGFGHFLLTKWNFPASIPNAVINHHDPVRIMQTTPTADRILQESTFIANQLSKAINLGHSCDEVLQEIPQQFLNDFKIPEGPPDYFYSYIYKKVNFFSQFLNLQIKEFPEKTESLGKPSDRIVFIHGHHAQFHPLIKALKTNGYHIEAVKALTPELQDITRVIISMPEPGRPLDIVFHEDNRIDDNESSVLKINIIDVDPLASSDKGVSYNGNMIFINQKHLDVRLVLHILDSFFFDSQK